MKEREGWGVGRMEALQGGKSLYRCWQDRGCGGEAR
jgi:hypothetical protein